MAGKEKRVNRVSTLAWGIALLLCTHNLLAQHGGHGGGGHRGSAGAGSGDTSDAGLRDFNHALAVQATPEQASHFHDLTRSTETARKLVQEILELSKKTEGATALSQKTTALKGAVEDAQGGRQDFIKSFSKSQKAGLKELTKKLEKVDSEVSKQWKVLEKQLADAKVNVEGIAGPADTLDKALGDLQSQQIDLGKEMGIQPPAT